MRTRYKTKPSDYKGSEFIRERFGISKEVLRYFMQNGHCTACNVDVREHIVLYPQELDSTFVVCWTEMSECRQTWKHFCVRSEDHPNRISRDEFVDLYGD